MWRVGWGREPWERSEAGGVIGNEWHLHHSPVSSPTEGLNEEWQQWKTREDQAWNFSLCFVCGSRPWGAAAFHLCLFILLLKCLKCSPVPASFFSYLSSSLQWVFRCHLKISWDSAFRMGMGSLFHQPGTVNENVLEWFWASLWWHHEATLTCSFCNVVFESQLVIEKYTKIPDRTWWGNCRRT